MRSAAKFYLATAVVLGVIAVVLAWNALPVYGGDASRYLPAAINLAAGRGLVDHFHPESDPTGADRLVEHGFLMPLLYGRLLPAATYPALFLLQSVVAAAVVGLTGWWFALVTTFRTPRWWLGVLGSLFMIGMFPFLFNGRPEPLVMLIMMATMIGIDFASKAQHWWIIGLGLGLIATAQPAVAVVGALFTAAYVCRDLPATQALLQLARIAAVAVLLALLLATTVYPYGVGTWLAGLVRHASRTLGQDHAFSWDDRFQAWFWAPRSFMVGMWYLLALVGGAPLVWRWFRLSAWPTGFALAALALMAVAWVIGITTASVDHLLAFAPLLCGGLLLMLEGDDLAFPITDPPLPPAWRRLGLPLAALALSALPAFGFARLVASAVFSHDPADYAGAKANLDELRTTGPAIAITGSVFSLCPDQIGVELLQVEDRKDYQRVAKADRLVIAQEQRPADAADDIPGFRLVLSYSSVVPRLLGVEIAAVPMSYGFAVYQRIAAPGPAVPAVGSPTP